MARLIDLIGEGEIVGLVDGARSIFLNDTPLMASDGSYNFKGVAWTQRTGLPDQPHIGGFPAAEQEVAVGAQVRMVAPLVRSITSANVDAVRVTVAVPTLTAQDTATGDLHGSAVDIAIEIRPNGGSYTTAVQNRISGKTLSRYERAWRVALPEGGCPWDIRVRRVSSDSTQASVRNETWWASYTEIIDGKFSYPDCALVALTLDAEQFGSSIPTRSYDVKGRKIKIPVNYDPITRVYTGLWNGAFKVAWTDNPAWVLYDLLSQRRFGLGDYLKPEQIDKWALYQIAQYCDQPVPDGYGGTEPRFTLNTVINSREAAYQVLQAIASAFRGLTYWSSGMVYAVADMPGDAVKVVAPANVIESSFTYSGTALKARHTVALVAWNDPSDGYRQAIEVVEDPTGIEVFGWREISVTAFGCTSRGQAHRFGKWILDSERHETETLSYKCALDHADVKPGDLVLVADPAYAGARFGGRLVATSPNRAVLDAPVVLTPNEAYAISMVLPDGRIVDRPILSVAGEHSELVLGGSGELPQPGAMWAITGSDLAPRWFRVLALKELEGISFEVTALLHDPTKYGRVEQGIRFDPPPYQRFDDDLAAPTGLSAVETLYVVAGAPKARITLSWNSSFSFLTDGYTVRFQEPNGAWVSLGFTRSTSIDLTDTESGTYLFLVAAVSRGRNRSSSETQLSFEALGWAGIPTAQVTHLELYGRGNATDFGGRDARFVWRGVFPARSYEIGAEPHGAGSGARDPLFRCYVVRIYDPDTDELLRVETTAEETYTYAFERNVEDGQRGRRGARRRFRVEVAIRDTLGRESRPARLTVENPVPAAALPVITTTPDRLYVTYERPDDLDLAGGLIWVSDTSGFDPQTTAPAYDGVQNLVQLIAQGGTTVYVRLALYDEFGKTGLTVSPEIAVTVAAVFIDIEPPPVPTGLVLTSTTETNPADGSTSTRLRATWDASPAEDLALYGVALREGSGAWIYSASDQPAVEWGVTAGRTYSVMVRAQDATGNISAYGDPVILAAAVDDILPGPVSEVRIAAAIRTVFLSWTNPTDADLSHAEIWESATTDQGDAVPIAHAFGSAFVRSGLPTGEPRHYWLRAVDTSGNAGPWSTRITATPIPATTVDIGESAITAPLIAAGQIITDHMVAGAIDADRLIAGTILQQANTGTTRLDPGRVLISGATTLSDWRHAGDTTLIAGGALAANTITANKLEIGSRGLTFAGLQFEPNRPAADQIAWTAGAITYVNDSGIPVTDRVAAGASPITAFGLAANGLPVTLYVYWIKGSATLSTTTAAATASGADKVILATYRGGSDLLATYGRTIIDGSLIQARTIQADHVTAGELVTTSAQIRNAIITDAHVVSMTADKILSGTVSATTRVNIGDTNFHLDGASRSLVVADTTAAARPRVRLGWLGSGQPASNSPNWGMEIYDATGALMFGSGGFGNNIIPAVALQNIPVGRVTGLGALSVVDRITPSNISTYIANAAIGSAQVGTLNANNISVGDLSAISANMGTITAGIMKSNDGKFVIDLNARTISIEV